MCILGRVVLTSRLRLLLTAPNARPPYLSLGQHESAAPRFWYFGIEIDDEDQAGGGYTDADIESRTPMARFASPEDVARAVAFLADPEQSGYVNGHALSVDGGWFADGSWDSLRRVK